MVYESGFTTRRIYSSRPVVSSNYYSVHRTSYPIYSSHIIRRPYVTGSRIISSPIRVVTSPTRYITHIERSPSPLRISRTTTRIFSSPEPTFSYSYTLPSKYYSSPVYVPSTYYTTSYIPSSYRYYTPSYMYSPASRIFSRSLTPVRVITSPVRVASSYLNRVPYSIYRTHQLRSSLSSEPFTTFREETDRIRHRAQSLMADLHAPVYRRTRSATPFPVSLYGPTSQLALDAYVARITNPLRHVAKEVHDMDLEPHGKYFGKSHLSCIKICGGKVYDVRSPSYNSDNVRNNINLLSWYLKEGASQKEKLDDDNNAKNEVEAVEVVA